MSARFHDKVLLISGATGIAEATALRAAAEGARVFVASLGEEECRALAGKLSAAGAGSGFRAGDLAVAANADEAVRVCRERFGRIDAVFNVAGLSGRKFGDGPLHECTEEGWDRTLNANAKSQFLVCRAALRAMLEQPTGTDGLRGTILNMASTLAFSPERRFFATHAYAASKAAVIGMSRAMAAYYAPMKIRVNAIAPSLVRTPMSRRAQEDPEVLALVRERMPLREDMLEAEDVAGAALFLLSDEASGMTGSVLTLDGGWDVS